MTVSKSEQLMKNESFGQENLPEGWVVACIGDLVDITSGKYIRRSEYSQAPDKPYPVAGAGGPIGWTDRTNFKAPILTLGRVGAVGALNIYQTDCWVTDNVLVIHPKKEDLFDLLSLFFRTIKWTDIHTGSSQPLITQKLVKEIEIPLAPLTEQRRIVAIVEELLTRVNATKERLARVSTILKRFRQAVLAAACSGRLTEGWRIKQNFLEEIGEIQEELSALPEGWTRAKLSQVAKINMGQSPPGSSYNERGDGLPFFQGKADFGDRYPTVRVWCTEPKKIAQPGDVLITIRAPVGPTNVANKICAIGRGLAAISPKDGMPTEFILFVLRLEEPELALSGTGSTFTAIKRKDLEQIAINIPPLTEQHEIVRRVEAMFKLADAVEKRVAFATARAKKLTQAILAKAFQGELVPTEAELARREGRSYESASDLLARIKSERESKATPQKVIQGRGHKKRIK